MKPIYLFADSQLLFWRTDRGPFLASIRETLASEHPKAAYIGASNGDAPEFFELFENAMHSVGIHDCARIVSSFPPSNATFLERADLILLAGGDIEKGWHVLQETGMNDVIIRRYHAGAQLIGTSAGAVQLGLYGYKKEHSHRELFETLKLVPFMVDAHNEHNEWFDLRKTIALLKTNIRGIGIPSGGGVAYHPDRTLEPLRYSIETFVSTPQGCAQDVLIPPRH